MILVLSLAVAALFGSGAFLLLKRDLISVAAGAMMISNAATLWIMAAKLLHGRAPIYPLPAPDRISDPLTQALALTAVVISFGVSALLLSLVYRVFATHRTLDQAELEQAERRERDETERTEGPV
jgi:multicomponent Na+:H+ antiporter subunit C